MKNKILIGITLFSMFFLHFYFFYFPALCSVPALAVSFFCHRTVFCIKLTGNIIKQLQKMFKTLYTFFSPSQFNIRRQTPDF